MTQKMIPAISATSMKHGITAKGSAMRMPNTQAKKGPIIPSKLPASKGRPNTFLNSIANKAQKNNPREPPESTMAVETILYAGFNL